MAIDAHRIARLARITLDTQEAEKMSQDLQRVLGWVDTLSQLEVDLPSATQGSDQAHARLREDCVADTAATADVMANAPQRHQNYFKVPKILT